MKKLVQISYFFFFSIALLGFVNNAWAKKDYIVSASGGDFTTIQACANAAKIPGDSCLVAPGVYNERVSLSYSGDAANKITFKGTGNIASCIAGDSSQCVTMGGFQTNNTNGFVIEGFEIKEVPNDLSGITITSTNDSAIIGNYIHHTFNRSCLEFTYRLTPNSNRVNIKNNVLKYCGYRNTPALTGISNLASGAQGMEIIANDSLIENNDVSHVNDFTILVGSKNVIRNNLWHDTNWNDWGVSALGPHIDGVQAYYGSENLIEGNMLYDNVSGDTHFLILQDYNALPDSLSHFVIRHNVMKNGGSAFILSDKATKYSMIYNNTIYNVSQGSWGIILFSNSATKSKLYNNLFYNSGGNSIYSVYPDSLDGFDAHNNFAYNSSCNGNCSWSGLISTEKNAVKDLEPKFINPDSDLSLQTDSPARNVGGWLTLVSSSDVGSGNVLAVDEARPFQDGWANTSPDWIAVGTPTNIAQIVSINYDTRVITLSTSITRKIGDPVWLYKNSSGQKVLFESNPDIGAFEYAPPVVNLTSPTNGSKYTAPAQIHFAADANSYTSPIQDVSFYSNNNLVGISTVLPFSYDASSVGIGTYSLTAKVTTKNGLSASSPTVNITVLANTPPNVAIVLPVNGANISFGTSIALEASANDPDGTITKVQFFNGATLIGEALTAPFSFSWVNVPIGSYTITAKATDNSGTVTTSSTVAITVSKPNTPPTVSLTSPTNGSSGIAPATFTLSATANDSDGTIRKVEFYNGGNLLGTDSTAPYSFSWTNVPAGSYSIRAYATDNSGATTTSNVAFISVKPGANVAPTVSLTSPANGSTGIAPATFTLSANASDADGTISRVDFYNGSTLLNSDTSAPYTFTWTNIPAGSFSVTAVATDNSGTSTTSSAIAITVSNPNVPPTISLTSPANGSTGSAPATFNLSANASDPDGIISKVEFYNGGNLLNTDTTAPFTFTWTNVPVGAYSIRAVATDNSGASTTSSVSFISVNPVANTAPTVSISSPANGSTGIAPAVFTLIAIASDSDGTISKVDFFNGATLLGSSTNAPYTFSWTNVPAGTFSITAVATDNSGSSTTSLPISISVSPSNSSPTVSLTSPSNGSTGIAPTTFTLTADASDPDGIIAKVDFYNGATLLYSDNSAPFSFTWTNVPAGSYLITAKATDNLGAEKTSSGVAINVTNPNVPPTISLTSPANGSTGIAPATFTLTASAADSDGTISKVDFYDGHTLLGTDSLAPYSFTWTNIPAGTYSISAKATDNSGAETSSLTSSIIITNPNIPPTVSLTSPANNSTAVSPAILILEANASDPDGSISKVAFYNDTTLLATTSSAPFSFIWKDVAAGTYRITAKGFDNLGAETTSSAAIVTVTNPNLPPSISLTSPGNGSIGIAPGVFNLSATATDMDGSISKVDFYNGSTLLASDTVAPFTFSWTNVPAGTYSITAKATDNSNATSSSPAVSVTVNNPNSPPTISISSPTKGKSFNIPATIVISASAADSDGNINKVDFYNGATLLGTSSSSPYNFSWENVPQGSYFISAKATDNAGAVTTSTAVPIHVVDPDASAVSIPNISSNSPPLINLISPANNSAGLAPANITIMANASDADGTIASVEFYNGSTLLKSLSKPPFTYVWPNVPVGTYTITAKATDNSGLTVQSNPVTISMTTVNTPPTISFISPFNGETSSAPGNFTLTALASDKDGKIAQVNFYNGSTLLKTLTSSPYTFQWSNITKGFYTLTAVAVDNAGLSATATTTVAVLEPSVNTSSLKALQLAGQTFSTSSATSKSSSTSTSTSSQTSSSSAKQNNGSSTKQTTATSPIQPTPINVPVIQTITNPSTPEPSTSENNIGSMPIVATETPQEKQLPNIQVALTSPTPSMDITANSSVFLSANALNLDTAFITRIDYYSNSTLIASSSINPFSAQWNNVPEGTYEIVAKATDNSGNIISSDVTTITVKPKPNAIPQITLNLPTSTPLTAPASVVFSAEASDSDGTVSRVEFYNGLKLLNSTNQNPYLFVWNNVPAGTYRVRAVVYDNMGATKEISRIITVKAKPKVKDVAT